MKIPTIFIPEKNLEKNIERLLKGEIRPLGTHLKYSKFEVIHAGTYAEGIAKLKKQRQRPFIFADNIGARIIDYEVNGDDAVLFKSWLDSVTGVAYKAGSTKFKLILRSDKLENIRPDFNQSFMPIDYDAERGIELDSKKGKYNRLLTMEEAKNHEFWLAAMNNDKEKLVEYVGLWFGRTKSKEGMDVYLRSNTDKDGLWALALGSGYGNSNAYGYYDLSLSARFVSGAQRK